MAGVITNIKEGLKTRLETHIQVVAPEFNAYAQPPDSISQFPAAAILGNAPVDYRVTLGDAIRSTLTVILYIASGDKPEGWAELDNYLAPTGTKSIKAAIQGDRTLGGVVDDSWLEQANAIGLRSDFGGSYLTANFVIGYVAC